MKTNQYKSFVIKTIIVGLVGYLLLSASIDKIERTMFSIIEHVDYMPGNGKLSSTARALLDELRGVQPDRREELLFTIRELVSELKPYTDELHPIFPSSQQAN